MANTSEDQNLLDEMRRQYQRADEACRDAYAKANEDRRFVNVPGAQWDQKLKARRGDRPTYEFPKLSSHTRQVINELKQSMPQGKVRGATDADRGLAELMQGICRGIERNSDAEDAYKIAYECAVEGGIGHWRLVTDYRNQDDFELDISIKEIRNPCAVKWDAASVDLDREDAGHCFVEDSISKTSFERQYPKADLVGWESDSGCESWRDRDQIKVCEYFWKEPAKRTLLQLADGRTLFADELGEDWQEILAQAGVPVQRQREVESHKVFSRLTNGHEWLTDRYEWPTQHIPVVTIWGSIRSIDGVDEWQGLVRPHKDQQRLHNVHRTAAIEAVAKAPKAPFIVKLSWIKGLERFWKNANSEDYPYLPVNDEAGTQMPQRAGQAEIPAALIQLAALDNEDIKAGTGIYDASLGARSNETSGRAIAARQMQGATSTYHFTDNLARGIRRTYKILCDMVPKVYDTARVVAVVGEDGGEEWKQLYQEVVDPQTGGTVVLNDISKGKYAVAVTVGPGYATQRMETAEMMSQLLGQIGPAFPPIAPVLANYLVKSLDGPGVDELSEQMRKILVAQGALPPEDGDEPPQPPQPDPSIAAKAEKDAAQAAKYGAEAEAQQMQNAITQAQLAPPQFDQMPPTQMPQDGFPAGGGVDPTGY